MKTFFQHLGDPEYMHVLLNPLPVYGLAIAVIGLALALIFRSRSAVVIALALIFISGLSAWPVLSYGQAAYDRIKAMSDPAGEQWLDEHMARGENLIYAFYLLAALAAAGIVLPIKWPRSAMPLGVAALVLGGATLGIGGWISYAGGHIRHKEFRFEPPPAARAVDHEHADEAKTEASPPQQMEHAGHEEMQKPEEPKSEEELKQLETSRLQLEASQKQLEASRKQLEATEAKPGASPAQKPSSGASPTGSPGEPHHHKDKP